MTNYSWWTEACKFVKGERADWPLPPPGAQLGCYRLPDGRGGPVVPAAIFLEDGILVAALGFGEAKVPVSRVWPWVAKAEHVIDYTLYTAAIAAGAWPTSPEPEAHSVDSVAMPESPSPLPQR